MKVFVNGTNQIKTDEGKWALPESVTKSLDELMTNEVEFLVEDQKGVAGLVQEYLDKAKYKKVIICVAGNKNWRFYNAGNWSEKYYYIHGEARGNLAYIERDFGMAEEADLGLMIWEGEDLGTFLDMLCLCALGKKCKLYLIEEGRWVDINSIGDLEEFRGQADNISEKDVRHVQEKCGFSDEMIEHIISENAVTSFQLADIICQAPVSLLTKKYLLGFLAGEKNLKHLAYCSVEENMRAEKSFKVIKHDIRAILDPNRSDYMKADSIWAYIRDRQKALTEALDHIIPPKPHRPHFFYGKNAISFEQEGSGIDGFAHCNKPLYLFNEWYDTDEQQHKESPVGYFTDPGMVAHYIKNAESENDTGEGYYRLEAWNYNDPEWKKPRYDYYCNGNGKICWFEKLLSISTGPFDTWYCPENRIFSNGDSDLSFSTPYKSGDVVLIDCRPFAPPFHAMILESRHQYDCCFPNIVFQIPGTSEWRLTPLKHRRFLNDLKYVYEPMLSPLYCLRKVKDEELTKDDDKLLELSRQIAGSEEKAAEIWRKWERNDGKDMKWEKFKKIFESL